MRNYQNITDWTIETLQTFIAKNNVPTTAVIEYEGCGTHLVQLLWDSVPEPPIEEFKSVWQV